MALKNNTWKLNQWYDQSVAGNAEYSTNVLSLYSWGYNNTGELGVNNKTQYSSPVQVGSDTTWAKIMAGTEGSSAAIKNDGTLWTWAKNSYGALGHNNQTVYSSPKQIPGTTWNEVNGQQQGMTATKTDGTLWTWGQNSDGQLGQNEGNANYTQRSSPVQVGSDTDWNKPVVSYAKSGGSIKTDGTLWMWGDNDDGRLGHNNETQYSSPVQLGSDTTWNQVYMGNNHTGATKTDGTLWSWGKNEKGQMGQNDRTLRSSPVQIPGTNWATGTRSLSSSDEFAAAIKTDGTLWMWGLNEHGQLGQNQGPGGNPGSYSSPVQVPGTTWRSVFCGRKNSFATKTDGTMWSWGYGNRGSTGLLGLNDAISRSSPTQIPGTTWSTDLGGSQFTTLGMKLI